ncbi:MAG TPA: DUF917 domain-containing protein [Chloroflexota bacterium]|jgi:hypothetical protein|nr:DUF917 domain-containing protein [Chloroflexota bacterium]
MRQIGPEQMDDLALGAAVLGTGGGGDPHIGRLTAIAAMRAHGPVTLIDMDELDDDALVVSAAMMGAPTVMVEKLPRGDEIVHAFEGLQAYLGRKVQAVTPIEAGGLNSTTPFIVAAALALPLVDADGMGRAFPELQMVSPTLHGIAATPMAIGDEKGNSAILNTCDNVWTERIARTMTIQMGGVAFIALYAMSGAQAKVSLVSGSVSLALRLGATIREAHQARRSPVDAILAVTGGRRLFNGKIMDVQRRTERGFARGEAMIQGLGDDEGHQLQIRFQNENLIALRDGVPVATVPDLITVLNAESGEPITTETLRYGFRVVVIGMPCAAAWRSEAGLSLVGPHAFGYDFAYQPL